MGENSEDGERVIKSQVIELIGKENWKDFLEWMYGQTVKINDDGSEDFYAWDVRRYVMLKRIRRVGSGIQRFIKRKPSKVKKAKK